MTEYITPVRIVAKHSAVENAEALLCKKPLQIDVREDEYAFFPKDSFVILDFGKEYQGGVRILNYLGVADVRIRFGESVSETSVELGEKNAGNHHSLRDIKTSLVPYSDASWGQTGYRFVRLDILSGEGVKIKSIEGIYSHNDLEMVGSFKCDDDLVNRIYDTAAHTTDLCIQNDMVWDGIKRDRLVWIGDMHPETITILSMYGACENVKNSLRFCREKAPLPSYMNNYPAYSLWWVCILSDYYNATGDVDFIKENKEYLYQFISQINGCITDKGELVFDGNENAYFLDWASSESPERVAGVYALCSLAAGKAELLFDALSLDKKVLSDIENRICKTLDGGKLKQVIAMKVLGGHSQDKPIDKLLKDGAAGVTTFMSYYILSAIKKLSKGENAVNIMKEYYGAMLSRGATSFWEDFDMSWLEGSSRIDEFPNAGEKDLHGDYGNYCYKQFRHSLCHGWSSGPVPFLFHHVVGIEILEAGCKKVRISPDLSGLQYVDATYPTPYGPLKVSIKNQNGKAVVKVDAPKEVKVVLE